MDKKIIWSPRAADDLEDICSFISKNSEYYASLVAERILDIVHKIPTHPYSGRKVPEYNLENLREKLYRNYRIVYRIKKDVVEIVTISHSSKLLVT